MRRLFDAKCQQGHIEEYLLEDGVRETPCKVCNEVATKQIGAVAVHLDVTSGDFPGATSRWLKDRQRKLAKEERTMANHGTPR